MLETGSFSLLPQLLLLVVLLSLWILCGWFSSKIMKSKGRSSGAGWALGLLLGIIGLIIAALLSVDEHGVRQQNLESGRSKKCSACRMIIDRDATICPYCHTRQ